MRSARVRSRYIPREGTPGGTRLGFSSTWRCWRAPRRGVARRGRHTPARVASSSATPGVDLSPRHPPGRRAYRDVRIRPAASRCTALRDRPISARSATSHPRGAGAAAIPVPSGGPSSVRPTEEGVARTRAACETLLIRRLQDSGEFVDAFCFVVHPGSTKLRVDFDVEPLCDSSYNLNKDVVPGVPLSSPSRRRASPARSRLSPACTTWTGCEKLGYTPLPKETSRCGGRNPAGAPDRVVRRAPPRGCRTFTFAVQGLPGGGFGTRRWKR